MVSEEKSEAYHDIDNENSNVTKGWTTSSQVGERLVTRSIDNEETGEFVLG